MKCAPPLSCCLQCAGREDEATERRPAGPFPSVDRLWVLADTLRLLLLPPRCVAAASITPLGEAEKNTTGRRRRGKKAFPRPSVGRGVSPPAALRWVRALPHIESRTRALANLAISLSKVSMPARSLGCGACCLSSGRGSRCGCFRRFVGRATRPAASSSSPLAAALSAYSGGGERNALPSRFPFRLCVCVVRYARCRSCFSVFFTMSSHRRGGAVSEERRRLCEKERNHRRSSAAVGGPPTSFVRAPHAPHTGGSDLFFSPHTHADLARVFLFWRDLFPVTSLPNICFLHQRFSLSAVFVTVS